MRREFRLAMAAIAGLLLLGSHAAAGANQGDSQLLFGGPAFQPIVERLPPVVPTAAEPGNPLLEIIPPGTPQHDIQFEDLGEQSPDMPMPWDTQAIWFAAGEQSPCQPVCYEAPPAPSYTTCRPRGGPTRLRCVFGRMGYNIRSDYRNYYSWTTFRNLSIAVALAAPFANTSLDADFGNWYQRDVRSSGTNDYAAFWKTFGEGQIFIPAFAGLWLAGSFLEEYPICGAAGSYGGRVTRAYLVGAPPMLFMQFLLGGGRPDEHAVGSQWRPFQDSNAVSGHAFMGAVPFITAAQMVENPWAKGALYICSTFTAWSRVNDHDHFATQACLGWYMAYLACCSVNKTDCESRCFEMMPLCTPEMTGVGVMISR